MLDPLLGELAVERVEITRVGERGVRVVAVVAGVEHDQPAARKRHLLDGVVDGGEPLRAGDVAHDNIHC
jgi:hypothetical protein